jgi:hypothetical protein
MSDHYDYGPLQTYEITWTSGHIERIQCHQVSYSGGDPMGDLFGPVGVKHVRRVQFHGEIEGRWLLVLSVCEDDIAAIRLVTGGEALPGESLAGGDTHG